jgi:hypothetical protein
VFGPSTQGSFNRDAEIEYRSILLYRSYTMKLASANNISPMTSASGNYHLHKGPQHPDSHLVFLSEPL